MPLPRLRGTAAHEGLDPATPCPPTPTSTHPETGQGPPPATDTHAHTQSPADPRPTREPLPTWGPLLAYSHLWGRCTETAAWTPGPPPVDTESRDSVSQKRDRTRPKRESQQERLRGKEPRLRTKERDRTRPGREEGRRGREAERGGGGWPTEGGREVGAIREGKS